MSSSETPALSLNQQLLAEFGNAIGWSDRLFNSIDERAMYLRPISLRHPCIFYLGHLPAFAWNHIFGFCLGRQSFNPEFDVLFERGIDPPDNKTVDVIPTEWPSLARIALYKSTVESELFNLLSDDTLELDGDTSLIQELHVVLEHYLMHVETFMYIVHQLPYDAKHSIQLGGTCPGASTAKQGLSSPVGHQAERVYVPAGRVQLGAKRENTDFCWCNELSAHDVNIDGFWVDRRPVTNGAFLEFVESGGYRNQNYWTEEGWEWVCNGAREHPQFWVKESGNWYYRGAFAMEALNELCPAWVSMAEASAFAKWRGARLLTEAEFHRAAYGSDEQSELRDYPWGQSSPDGTRGNFGLRSVEPTEVGAFPNGASAFGIEELVGNGWEWTRTVFAPFPGFARIDSYPGYSADFFDGRHYVLKGASPVTDERLLRRSFRNWFQPHYPYIYAKFRLVSDAKAA